MTPASFAKLALRMLIAGMWFLYLPPKISLGVLSVTTSLQTGVGPGFETSDGFMLLLMMFILSVIIVASLIVWVRVEWLTKRLLPSGTSPIQISNYEEWQTTGLRFIGGWLALKACLGFQQTLIGNGIYMGDSHLAIFYFVAAFFLIIGWSNLLGIFSRKAQKA